MVGEVDAIDGAGVGHTIEVLTVVGHTTEGTATRNIEAFNHITLEVILVEVVSSAGVAPVAGVEELTIAGNAILATFSSIEGVHEVPHVS